MNTLKNLERDLELVRQAFRIPGMAVAIIQGGEVVFSQGFGWRDVEAAKPFTPDTLCLVASTTKSLTAGLTGILVDEGIIAWTTPLRKYWPDFKMVDKFATQEMTLEDMLCHRSGLPYHENLLTHGVGRELTDSGRQYRQELLKRLAYFEPSHPFRTHFQYQDVIYTCAGAILELVTGQEYEEMVQQRLLEPLGMQNSTFSRRRARESGLLAINYGLVAGQVVPITFYDARYFSPAAGLYSSAIDMIRWVGLQLNNGRIGSQQLISTESLNWIHRPHMVVDDPLLARAVGGSLVTYGQGWFQSNLHDRLLISHGGSFNGYRTWIAFLPELDCGITVLTNLNLTSGVTAAGLVIADRLTGSDNVASRIADYLNLEQIYAEREVAAAQAFAAGRDLSHKPNHPLEEYCGVFQHPGYGTFTVEWRDGLLWQTYDGRTFAMQPYNGETFETHYQSTENHLLQMPMTFENDAAGRVAAVRIPIVPGISPPRFKRV